MDYAEARAKVIQSLDKAFGALSDPRFAGLTSSDVDVTFADMEIESLTQLALCLELEDVTGLEVTLAELAAYPSVNALARYLAPRVPG